MFCEEIKLAYKPQLKAADRPVITKSRDCFNILYPLYDQNTIHHVESFIVLFVNRSNAVVGWKTISIGGTSATVVDPKVVFQTALLMNASGIVLSHNHPSGGLRPSVADLTLTNKINQGGKLLDINLLDHIILTGDGEYYSLADNDQL